jgi:hypothetical protein
MATASEFYNELKGVNSRLDGTNSRLDDVKGKLDDLKAAADAVRAAVQHIDLTLQWGFNQLIMLGTYTNEALYHIAQQNDTMICILENISKNTCDLVNQAHLQTELQTSINHNTTALADLYAATHAEAALAREREETLRKKIEECCPPKPREPICGYKPCVTPETLREPPGVENKPPR